jgi:chromosome segregation ATPase
MKNELSQSYSKALELHNKILVSAQLAQNNLWEMCAGLKEMRDGKLYKELGYQNFEDYCNTEFNITRMQAHKYISIIENSTEENVNSSLHFGVTKLYLLSTLSNAEQEKITAENDVESMTVKQLEEEIKELKGKNKTLEFNMNQKKSEVQSLQARLEDTGNAMRSATADKRKLKTLVENLENEIEELRSRPIEAAVTEPTENERQLKETIRNLELTTEQQLEDLQNQQLRDVRELHRKHDEELKAALAEQKRSYERKLDELESRLSDSDTEDNTLALLEVYISTARDALFNLMAFASKAMDKSSCFSQIKALLAEYEKANDELIYGR